MGLMLSLIAGFLLTAAGVIVFMGRLGTRRWTLAVGKLTLNYEGIGFLMFFSGIVLMLVYLITRLKPLLLSPGMAG